MKTLIKTLLFAFCFCLVSPNLTAQDQDPDPPTPYHVLGYMKVKPSMHGDYLKLEKAWKKIHAAKKKAGSLDQWALSRVVTAGANAEYNYVTRNTLYGEEKLANYFEASYMPENWTSLLTPDELELVMRTDEIRTMVKTEVWATAEIILADDVNKATIHVFNYFDHPEGKDRDDHFKVERDIWMPVHKARIDDGKMKGWVMLGMVSPYGSGMPYHDATVDIYTDMEEYLTIPFGEYFDKIHAGKDMDELMKRTNDNTDLIRGELRMNIDSL